MHTNPLSRQLLKTRLPVTLQGARCKCVGGGKSVRAAACLSYKPTSGAGNSQRAACKAVIKAARNKRGK